MMGTYYTWPQGIYAMVTHATIIHFLISMIQIDNTYLKIQVWRPYLLKF